MLVHNEICVEKRHIDAAKLLTNDGYIAACHDPVALALSEQTAHRWFVAHLFEDHFAMTLEVRDGLDEDWWLQNHKKSQVVKLSPKVSEWLARFMNDEQVLPFAFVMSYDTGFDDGGAI